MLRLNIFDPETGAARKDRWRPQNLSSQMLNGQGIHSQYLTKSDSLFALIYNLANKFGLIFRQNAMLNSYYEDTSTPSVENADNF